MYKSYSSLQSILFDYNNIDFWKIWNDFAENNPNLRFYHVVNTRIIWFKLYDLDFCNDKHKQFIKYLHHKLVIKKKSPFKINFNKKKIGKYLLIPNNPNYQILLNVIDTMYQIINLDLQLPDFYDVDVNTNKVIVLDDKMMLEKIQTFFKNKEVLETFKNNCDEKTFKNFINDINKEFNLNL